VSAACPRCGEGLVDGQEYCLGCGARLPGQRSFETLDGGWGWQLRAAALLAVALAGAAFAIAATDRGRGGPEAVTATGGFATVPAGALASPDTGTGIVDWPSGEEGWTIALASIPQTEGRRTAVERARAARRRGLSSVGILDSSTYASLHPGYWVVFAGIFRSEAEAVSGLEQARRVARTATVRRIVP